MSEPYWNDIEFGYWEHDKLNVSVNRFAEGAVVLEIASGCRDESDLSEWMTPEKARHVAAKLIEAADAVERAGTFSPPKAPYPFCRTPKKCAGNGYCPADIACND